MEPDSRETEQTVGWTARQLLAGVTCFLFALFGLSLGETLALSQVWPASGLGFYLFCRYRLRVLPAVLIALLAAYYAHGFSFPLAFLLALGDALALALAAHLVCRNDRFDGSFESPRDLIRYTFFGVATESFLAAGFSTAVLALAMGFNTTETLDTLQRIALGHATGGLFLGPVLFTWRRGLQSFLRTRVQKKVEVLALMAGLVASLYLILYAPANWAFDKGPHVLLPLPFVIWAALRMGPQGTSTVVFVMGSMGLHATVCGLGPFATRDTISEDLYRLALFLAFLTYLMLLTSSKLREHERTTDALRKTEAERNALLYQFRTLVENVNDVLYRMHPDGTIAYVSPAVFALSGYKPEELTGTHYGRIVHPDDRDRMWENFKLALSGTPSPQTFKVVAKDGSLRHVYAASRVEVIDGKAVALLGVLNDRTEVVQMMEAIEHSEGKYRALVENIGEVLYQITSEGQLSYVSPVIEQVLGYRPDELEGQPFTTHLFSEDHSTAMDHFQRTLTGESLSHELRLIHRNGNLVHVLSSSRPSVVENKTTGVTGILSNITPLRAAEAALRQRDAQLSAAFENLPFDFWVCDVEGRYVIQNSVSQEHWGDCLGKRPGDLGHPDAEAKEHWQHDQAQALRGEIIRREFSVIRNGFPNYYQKILAPIRDGEQIIGTLGVNVDITEQRRLEEAYTRLVESSPQGLSIIQGNRFVFANNALHELMGYPPGMLLELPPGEWLARLHPVDADALRATYDQMLSTQARPALDTPPLEVQGTRADGSERTFLVYCIPLVYRGQPAVQAVYVDVTQQKESERERQHLEAQMQHAQKLESLGVMAGGIAHDFNNLLAGIMGHAELVLLDHTGNDEDRESLERIVTTAQRAAELCQQMLAYAGRAPFTIATISLNDVIEEMVDLLRISISKKADIQIKLDPRAPSIRGDASQIRQVVMNLITNASEALTEEPGTVAIRTGLLSFEEAVRAEGYLTSDLEPGDYCFIEVEDSGCGIDAHSCERLFEPFYSTKFAGRGLGLAAVLGIVRTHHGVVLVDSTPGVGSCFRVILPTTADTVPPPREKKTVPQNESPLTGAVLVVDDEETVRTTAERLLHRQGLEVILAADGEEGLAAYEQHRDKIVLVLLDVTMPRMGGDEVLRALRESGSHVPVIVISGYAADDVGGRFADLEPSHFVHKPFAYDDLVDRVRSVLTTEV